MKMQQTAGRDNLGDFAPEFARLNDDVLFGEVWSSDKLSLKNRSILTISSLVSKGLIDASFHHHLVLAKENGVTKAEMAEILTHLAFYAGWPNTWAAFRVAKEVYQSSTEEANGGLFGLGELNTKFEKYFIGKSYLKPLTDAKKTVFMANVTFEPKCRNNWHIHKADKGGGQILLCVNGTGWYQEWGKPAQRLHEGDVITIPSEVKHWHGATKDSWFSHIAIEVPGVNTCTKWLEPVDEDLYKSLKF